MNAGSLIASLASFTDVLPSVVKDLSDADVRWRPGDGAWSILEIVSHLADEEEADFRPRLERTLRDPTETWSPIDPEGWAVERRYNEGDLASVLERFGAERAASLRWLRGLETPDWSRCHQHPAIGSLRAGELLAAWAAHDLLHLRQIAKRRHQLVARDGGDYGTRYAGAW